MKKQILILSAVSLFATNGFAQVYSNQTSFLSVTPGTSTDVGIGTSTPALKLQVVGSGGSTEPLVNSENTMGVYDNAAVASGVGGQLFFGGTFDNAGNQTTFAGIRGVKLNGTDGDYNGQLEFYTRTNGVNNWAGTQRMVIDNLGNVGIGTSTPTYGKLDVDGIVSAAPTSLAAYLDPVAGAYNAGTRIALNASTANPYGIGIGTQDPSTGTYPMWFQTGDLNGGGYKWFIGGNQKMTMDPAGNIGIGTSTPSTQLHTTGDVRFEGLTPNAYSNVVVIDGNGNLATQPFSATGVTLNCNTTNF